MRLPNYELQKSAEDDSSFEPNRADIHAVGFEVSNQEPPDQKQ